MESSPGVREIPDPQPGPLEAALRRERERIVRKALLDLPEANRLALLLHVWGGYSYEEIAAFAEVPVTTVEGRIFRARAKLRRLLRSEAAGIPGLP
ncbi:MAG: RNA polymerase sigma factor [Armatimonadetes bacterium]|nr:RNA polymerase sigma factor [Armatimonadota bacterium]